MRDLLRQFPKLSTVGGVKEGRGQDERSTPTRAQLRQRSEYEGSRQVSSSSQLDEFLAAEVDPLLSGEEETYLALTGDVRV